MKLNYKRTLLVGFAFFLICVFWQAYDTLVPLMLTNKFGLDQTWSGVIMSLDNILALFMLPLFGALSDKKDTRFGKRTPFIFIGTICAIVCFMGLTFADNAQLKKLDGGNNDVYWNSGYVIENKEYQSFTNKDVPKEYSVQDYASKIRFGKTYAELTESEKAEVQNWYATLDYDQYYVYDYSNNVYKPLTTEKDPATNKITGYKYLDGSPLEDGVRKINSYSSLVSSAESQFAKAITIFIL
ncbi:MAG: MFS transporter [Clostridia bacterium]|nr:MFS transporter [Clostridia bacterium]